MSYMMSPAEAAQETARQIEASLSRTSYDNPVKAEVLIHLAASWRLYAFMLTHSCTCAGLHNPYNAGCELVPRADPFRGGL